MKFTRLPFLLSFWIGLLAIPAADVQAELVVVVNVRSGVATMTRNEVVNVFFGRNRQFFNGLEARPADMADSSPDRARFYKALVGKELAEVNSYWARQVFSGRMQPPVKLASTDEMIKWVIANPGGIGFVDSAKADARVRVVYELAPR